MEFEKKISEINTILRTSLKGKKNIVIWAAGIHTEKFICMTCILDFWEKVSIVDRFPKYALAGKPVKTIEEIQWNLVDAVIISSLTYQQEIENELLENKFFHGEIIRLYGNSDKAQFFELQKDTDFLVLEKESSWKEAVRKSKQGYAGNDILQYDYDEFLARKCKSGEKNENRRYYDVLFYMLKTVIQLKTDDFNVLDFGGGFGTVFIDLKYYLQKLNININWTIIEQEKIVNQCNAEILDTGITYIKRLGESDGEKPYDFVLLGSSLQYLENYQHIVLAVIERSPHRIALLKTPVSDMTFASVQYVNRQKNYNHYSACYPCRVMAEEELISLFSSKYYLEDSTEDLFNSANNGLQKHMVRWKDFFFERIN